MLVGIDRYERLPYPLEGCVNDARVLGGLLESSFGFQPEAITWLLNDQATRDRIIAELDALVDATGQDDIVVIAYSGHGSQMTDRDGDEPDGMDETIVPYDSGRAPDENRDITDDELYDRLLALSARTPYVTLLFDCCHSGSVSRDGFGDRVRWVPPDRRPASDLPPSARPRRGSVTPRDLGPSGWLPVSQRYVLIAGCLDRESSYEHTVVQDGAIVSHGALSYFLAQQLASAKPGTTYRDVFEATAAMVTATYPRQHPQMEGASDRELFGVRDIVPMRFAAVGLRSDSVVTIRAGLAHGAILGSRWAVYPPATKEVNARTPRLGVVKLTAVHATESEGDRVEEQSPGAITDGCRAVEEAHPFGDFRLRVHVVLTEARTELAAPILDAIGASHLLVSSPDGEPADVRVYLLSPRERASSTDPVPQIHRLTETTWAVVGRDGELLVPSRPAGEASSAMTVVTDLEAAARYRHALGLRNPDPGELNGKIKMILKRVTAGGWVEAEPDPTSGLISYTDGDRVAIEIRNGHHAPIHVSVLDFGVAGAIGALHPVRGASEPLAAGRSVSVGERSGEEIELRLPKTAETVPVEAPAGGTETFKLFVTMGPADLGALLQPGYRADRAQRKPESPLEQLLSLALTGLGTRDITRPTTSAPEDAWVTVERSFTLRKRGT